MISHRHRCIFIHIPKCGGGTIEELIWGWPRKTSDLWMGFVSTHENKYQTGGLQHLLGRQVREEVGAETYGAYFKFSMVRNPWDRAWSQFHYMKARPDLMEYIGMREHDGFRTYLDLIPRRLHVQWEQQHRFVLDDNGDLIVDHVGRFENFSAEVHSVLRRLGIDCGGLPHLNRSEHAPYRDAYSAEEIDMVRSLYAKDIELFGYTFA